MKLLDIVITTLCLVSRGISKEYISATSFEHIHQRDKNIIARDQREHNENSRNTELQRNANAPNDNLRQNRQSTRSANRQVLSLSSKKSLSELVKTTSSPIHQPSSKPIKPFPPSLKPLHPTSIPVEPTKFAPAILPQNVGKLTLLPNPLRVNVYERRPIPFGSVLALNGNGQILAASDLGLNRVLVYRWSATNSSWIPFGKAPINVTAQFTHLPLTDPTVTNAQIVLSNNNGQVMALNGMFYRFHSNEQLWTRDDVNTTANPFAGAEHQASFSADMSTGALPGKSTTTIYRWNGNIWKPFGNVLHTSSQAVSLSANGTVIAVLTSTGAKVFQWSRANNNWVQVGNAIKVATSSISTISLSSNGQRLVLLSGSDGNIIATILAFQYSPTRLTWIQVGPGVSIASAFGLMPLLVSGDGRIVAATIPVTLTRLFQVTYTTTNSTGHDKYQCNQIGGDLGGLTPSRISGPSAVAMSADGRILVVSYSVRSSPVFTYRIPI